MDLSKKTVVLNRFLFHLLIGRLFVIVIGVLVVLFFGNVERTSFEVERSHRVYEILGRDETRRKGPGERVRSRVTSTSLWNGQGFIYDSTSSGERQG